MRGHRVSPPTQPVTIRSPFPLAEFAELIQGRYARPVTYEDALLVWRGDDGINATPTAFVNGQKTQVVAPEQFRTLIRQLGEAPNASMAPAAAAGQAACPKQER